MSTRHITYQRLSDLKPAVRNPKLHDGPGLVQSLIRHGWTEPCVVDERTNRLVAGHGRREACIMLRQMGDPPPEGVHVDDDGEWLVPVLRGWESKTDTEAEAYIVASNQLSTAGGWHVHDLATVLEDVVTTDASLMESMGFTADSLDDLLRRVDPETIGDQDPDKPRLSLVPDPDVDPDDGPTLPTPDLSLTSKQRVRTCPDCGYEFED